MQRRGGPPPRPIADAQAMGIVTPREIREAQDDLADTREIASQPLPWQRNAARDLCRLLGHAWQQVAVPSSN